MKVTFLMPGYIWGPSGGYKVVYEYANQLAIRGHSVVVVHPRCLEGPATPPTGGLYWRARKMLGDLRDLAITPGLDWYEIDNRVELRFTPSSSERYIPEADAIFATTWLTVQPVLNCTPEKGTKCYLIQGYETYHGPKDGVDATWRSSIHKVVVSQWLLELGHRMGCEDITRIPNAVDHNRYALLRPIWGRPKTIAMAFSPAEIKGAADGIEAIAIAKERFPSLRVLFFSTSRRMSWIPHWIEYYRNPPQEFIVNEIYNKASIFMSSSHSEGFGLPPAEAAACGCAIVATDSGGIREYIEPGKSAGFSFSAKRPGATCGKPLLSF